MKKFLEELRTQRWDDTGSITQPINQSLAFLDAISFLVAYVMCSRIR